MKHIAWQGVYPALLTPFTENDTIDYPLFKKNLDAQLAAGVDGVIICGSLGEASTLTKEEKTEFLTYTVKEVAGRVPVLINVAEQITSVAIAMAQEAEQLGADGIMLLPPLKYKAADDEVVTYFQAVASAIQIPILIYNNPVDYGIKVSIAMFEELLPYENIQAVKESTRDLANITNMINRFGNRFKILGGVDTISLECLVLGADGLVAGLVDAFPAETVAIYRLVKAKRYDEALAIYRWFMPLLELDIHPKLVQYIKLAATAVGISSEYVRAPRLVIKGEERERVLKIINDALANRPTLPDYLNLAVEAV
ncbi:dihydrodipicolinate synthase family protein [Pedobacter sp. LMG 31464]|uniref:Dihydrodipicolinate synthase family protein n=1 Tax=Pedobacter planticolens TaxID=2679964 RepID=A0A923DUV6_9SPHI|nr:dihydrodipicolinate synthase family protein [Pedobacter planticolens]MBB2144317.1 dihydrodipicolinate synthase family protein [Pedobacter planticolens]